MGTLLGWSDASRKVAVRANAETVEAVTTALSFGAEGIGLARSEHMFFSRERMVALRRLILSEDADDRAKALTGLVDFQTGDYSADLHRHARPPGHRAPVRSAAARVPAAHRRGYRGDRAVARPRRPGAEAPARSHRRDQPDARPSRRAPRHHLSRNPRRCRSRRWCAGVRAASAQAGRTGDARGHGAVRLHRVRSRRGQASRSLPSSTRPACRPKRASASPSAP